MNAKDGFTAWVTNKIELRSRLGDERWCRLSCAISSFGRNGWPNIGLTAAHHRAVLNHQSGHQARVAGVYNRSSYAREVRNALALWAAYICALVDGSGRKFCHFPPTEA